MALLCKVQLSTHLLPDLSAAFLSNDHSFLETLSSLGFHKSTMSVLILSDHFLSFWLSLFSPISWKPPPPPPRTHLYSFSLPLLKRTSIPKTPKIYTCSLHLSPELQTYTFPCLLNISNWISKKYFKLIMPRTEFLIFFPKSLLPEASSVEGNSILPVNQPKT